MFKTISDCGLELVAFSVSRSSPDDDLGGYADDMMPVRAARASFGKQDKTGEKPEADVKLMHFLADNKHCYHPSMQVLTARGWKRWDECSQWETFVIPDPESKQLKLERLEVFSKSFSGMLKGFSSQRMSYLVTPDHTMWFSSKNSTDGYKKIPAQSVPNWGHYSTTLGYTLDEPEEADPLTEQKAAFVGFYLGDGYSYSANIVGFRLKKSRKIDYVTRIMTEAGIDYSIQVLKNGVSLVKVPKQDWMYRYIDFSKKSSDKYMVIDPAVLSVAAKKGLFDGLFNSDGSYGGRTDLDVKYFCSTSPRLLLLWETLSWCLGRYAFRNNENRPISASYGPSARTSLESRAHYKFEEDYNGLVYCTTSSTGLLIVRGASDEFSFVCGNCTPFEYQHATFLIECPLFIRSQIHRHRTFAYNEISRRYTSENLEFWIPDKFRGQSKDNKQASDGVIDVAGGVENWQHYAGVALGYYNSLVEQGVAREIARAVLPQSLLTRFYMGGTLRNWAHFIELRRDAHAQYEVQVIANRVADELRELWPESCNALGI